MSLRRIGGRQRDRSLIRSKNEIHRLLKADPKLPGQRIRELIVRYAGGKTIGA